MRLNVTLLDDIERHKESLDIPKAAHILTSQEKSLLLVAGSEDLTAKPVESQTIYDVSSKEFAELHIIPKTGLTIDFFRKYLVNHPIPYPE
jgi:hypothetical protein